jgi:HEAT repeat protein
LENALSQNQNAGLRHQVTYHLLVMGDSAPFFVTTLINSLTNNSAGDRATTCSFLAQINPPPAAAIPALRQAMQDPEPEVRRRAEVALSKIELAHAATSVP